MSAHRAVSSPRRRFRIASVRLRLLLTLGLVLTPGVMGTYAAWTDTATVSGIELKTGTLDLAIGATAGDQLTGQGGTWNYTALSLTAMLPGESVAKPITVRNAGTTPLKYTAAASTTNNTLSPSLKLTVVANGTVGSSGSQATGNRTGSCTGGTPWVTAVPVSTTSGSSSFPAAAVVLQPGATTSICVLVALDGTAPNTMQNQTSTLNLVLHASQP